MSLFEKLVIQNKVRSEQFLTNYFIYLFFIIAIFALNYIYANIVMEIVIVFFTAFIHLHTLFLAPSLITMIFSSRKQSPIWERAIIVALVNITLCIMSLTLTSIIVERNHQFSDGNKFERYINGFDKK